MPARRIIPCLDICDGRVVKGVRFRDHRDVGDPLDHALRYRDEGADELVFYDITASADRRSIDPAWVERLSRAIDIPFAVAGGIGDYAGAARCLDAGADKISINSPAIARPELIGELAEAFGSQCVVVGIDSQAGPDGYRVRQYSGRPEAIVDPGLATLAWAAEAAARGAGEIVLNCMARDGVGGGFDVAHVAAVVDMVSVPVVASGGAGAPDHFRDLFRDADASGALAATVFHDRLIAIPDLKEHLQSCGIEMRR